MTDEPNTNKDSVDAKLDAALDKGKVSLKDTIQNAAIEAAKDIKIEEPKKEPEVKVEDKKEEEKKEDELGPEERKFADSLYKGLNNKDPKIQRATLELLAKAANLDLKEVETKKEIKEAEKSMIELLKEGLGEFDFLADKLGPVLEKVLKATVIKETAEIKEIQRLEKEEKVRSEVTSAIDSAFAEFTNSNEVASEVKVLMDKFQPGAKMSHKEYFRSLIVLAASNKGINLKSVNVKANTEKITRNRNDAASRLASERSAEVKDIVRTSQFKNLKDAVNDAAEKVAELMGSKK